MRGLKTSRQNLFAWHPLILAIFPIVALLANNITEIKPSDALRSLSISLFVAMTLLFGLKLIVKDWFTSAFIVSLGIILFFSYGHVYNYLEPIRFINISMGRHRILAPIYFLMFLVGIVWSTKPKRELQIATQTLNIIALVLLVIPLIQISFFFVTSQFAGKPSPNPAWVNSDPMVNMPKPDIYYIILDAYPRDDVLQQHYEFDNKYFLNELSALGFYIARCSMSNYAQTQLSLASSMNFNYVEKLDTRYSGESSSRVGLPGYIKNSAVRQQLKELGYSFVAFETGYYWTQVESADVYISPQSSRASLLDVTGGMNAFELILLKNSASLILVDGATVLPQFIRPDLDYPNRIHRERVLFTLNQLGNLPKMTGPKFIFTHIVSPHKPYVFGPEGEIVGDETNDIIGFRDQVQYLNSRLIPMLRRIISNSSIPPIIIVQADHGGVGTFSEDRHKILNAYYLPAGGEQLLYENISPVNSFRLIFNHYFGGNFEILEDISFFSTYKHPYKYTIITENRTDCSAE